MLGALFGFKGRLSRPGYWEVLASIVLIDVALLLGRMAIADGGLPGGLGPQSPFCQVLLRAAPWAIVIFTAWSLLAAGVKRLHDRGRPGALMLVALIPVIGWLWLLIDLVFLEGTEGRNRYGRPPHALQPEARSQFNWAAEPAAPAATAYEAPLSNWHDIPAEPSAPAEAPVASEPVDGEHGHHAPAAPIVEEAPAEVHEAEVHAEPEPQVDEPYGEEGSPDPDASLGHEGAPAHHEAPAEAHVEAHEDQVLDITSGHDHAPAHAN